VRLIDLVGKLRDGESLNLISSIKLHLEFIIAEINILNMSRKYFDKLMTGTGVTDKKVKSSLAERLMKNMGWEE
jgi:hypothetical protein